MSARIEEIVALTGGRLLDPAAAGTRISGAASVFDAAAGDVTFLGNVRYLAALRLTKATAALVPLDFPEQIPALRIAVESPSLAFSKVLEHFAPAPVVYQPGVHSTAIVGKNVEIGAGVSVQPYAILEDGVKIGADTVIGAHVFVGRDSQLGAACMIYPQVVIRERSLLGSRVTIHSGVVIGSDGFGFELADGRRAKVPQIGIVQIDDDVEIGANTTIDRARFGRTWIQKGTKIDNQVQIAHNVVIGEHSIIVAQVGISGSVKLGNYVTLAGQSGVAGHIVIGDQAVVAGGSGVTKNIKSKSVVWGFPATDIKVAKERVVKLNRLGKLYDRVEALERALEQLSGSIRKSS